MYSRSLSSLMYQLSAQRANFDFYLLCFDTKDLKLTTSELVRNPYLGQFVLLSDYPANWPCRETVPMRSTTSEIALCTGITLLFAAFILHTGRYREKKLEN